MPGRLLIVEDEEPIRRLLRDYFVARGFAVDCAGELGEARRLLQANTYTVVVSDVCLSGGPRGREGLLLVEELRRQSGRPGIVLLTALELSLDELPAAAQPDLLLRKPLRLATVADHVEQLAAAAALPSIRFA